MDDADVCAQRLRPTPIRRLTTGNSEAPVPNGNEGLCSRPSLQGGRRVRFQRQRIDMTSPATMAPKPMAKFQADNETINGILSPAT